MERIANREKIEQFVHTYTIPLVFGGIGLLLVLSGIVLAWRSNQTSQRELSFATVSGVLTKELVVDIQGAITSPGVYRLPEGSRVIDLLEKAGGLKAGANNQWVAKSLNQAQKLVDGAKLYIPFEGEMTNDKISHFARDPSVGASRDTQISNAKININTASASELESLTGIGEKTAEKIISGRPYTTIEELVERKIVYQSMFEKIKESVTVLGN